MAHIDALSRAPINNLGDAETDQLDELVLGVFMTITEEEQVAAMQRTDPRLSNIANILSRKETERTATNNVIMSGYIMEGGLIYRKVKNGDEVKHL